MQYRKTPNKNEEQSDACKVGQQNILARIVAFQEREREREREASTTILSCKLTGPGSSIRSI